jgi:hypothetical protein
MSSRCGVTLLAPAWSDRALIALARRRDTNRENNPMQSRNLARP